jgi:hypothetical protein
MHRNVGNSSIHNRKRNKRPWNLTLVRSLVLIRQEMTAPTHPNSSMTVPSPKTLAPPRILVQKILYQ